MSVTQRATRPRPPAPRRSVLAGGIPSLRAGWEAQSWPLRILRGFLGVTFVYAGVQKFMDPNFLHAGSRTYIGTQLHAFSQGTPMGPIMAFLGHLPVLTGIGIALLEIAVGLGTVLAIAPITWAAIGLGVNLTLFLSATWHVHPYFLGSDSIYAVAWGAYLAGMIELAPPRAPVDMSRAGARQRARDAQDLSRRRFLRAAVVAGGSLFLGIVSSTLAGKPSAASAFPPPTTTPTKHPKKHPGGSGSGDSGGGSTATPSGSGSTGTPIATLDSVPIGGAVSFDDPAQGPAVLCRLSQSTVAAYSRVCTHAGCLVDFDSGSGLLYCPCHGAEFDPAHGARVIGGPAPVPLASIPVVIDHATGKVVATS